MVLTARTSPFEELNPGKLPYLAAENKTREAWPDRDGWPILAQPVSSLPTEREPHNRDPSGAASTATHTASPAPE